MSENNLLTIFEGSKIRLNYDGKNIQGKIMLSDGDSVEIEPFEISESELNDCWYGFSYKGKDFDMNVCLNDAENEGTPVCIYPVINGTTITTSDFAAIKKDSVFFEKQIAKEIINNNQMENKTMEFEKFKNYRNDFMIKNWNEKGQGNNSSFKKVGSLESIDSNNREQIIAVEKSFEHETGGTLGDDRAELVLKMANYDESSFKFLFDRENGNFVEYKNNEIVDVETPMGMLNYLHDEIQFQLESPLAKRADYFDEGLFESMQDLYNKSNPFYTWDDLYILAEKETYLPAKDAAREQIGKAAKKFGIDIEASEIPEDAIADFLEKHPELNRFNESGQMLAEIDSENKIVNKPFIPSEYVLNKLQEKRIEVVTDKKEFERILESQAVLQKMATSLSDLKKLSASVKKQEEAISNEQEKSKELAEKESTINNHSFSLFVLEMQKYQDIFPNNEPVKITDLNYSKIPYYDFELFIEKDKNDQLRLLCNYKNRNNVGSVDNHSFYNLTNDSFDIIDPLSQFGFDMLKEVLEVSKAELSRKDYIPEIQEKLKDILESHQIKEKAILANLIEKNNERKNFVESRIDQISREEKRNAEKTLESWLNLADEMEDSLWNKDQLQVKKIFTENGTEERKPIAVISESDMQIFKGVKDRNLYADKSYIADHYINRHHNARTFLNIQNVLDNYDNIYFDKDQNSTGFTKRYGKMIDCVFMRVNEGKIILFGTTFEQPEYKIENGIKRGRFEKITPARKQEQNMSLEGSTPLSHNSIDNNEKAAVAISDVNDNSNISQPAEKSSNTLEDGSMFITQMKTEEIKANISVRTPSDIVPYLNDFSNSEVENFGVVLLDASYKVKEIRAVTVGTINRSIVHAREVFKEAVRNSAASVLIFHNHPSGNFEPSYEDINTTQKLMEASDIIGIPVLDHIIVSKEGYFSFEEHDMLNARTQNFIHDGTTYGFAHNGKIYLNSDVLSAEAAMHEYTHLWDNLTRKENPMLWNKGLEIFKGTSIWNEVINDEHYQDIKDDENLVLSECHARITGKVTETVLNRIAELDGNEKQAEMIEWDKETVEFIFENYRDIFEKNSFSSVAEFTTATMKDLFSPVEQQKQDIAIDSSAFERMEKFFEGKTSSLGNGDYQNFKELYDWVQEEFPSKDSEHVLLETVSRMIYSNINFGDLEPASYDDVYGFGDGAEHRFDVSDDIAKRLINNEITPDWMTIQNEVNDFACRKLMDLKENTPDMLVTDTINEAFEISKKYEPIAEKNLNAYTKSEKTQNIRKALENIKKTYTEDSHDIRIDYGTGIFGADLEALIKGNDAAIYGEKSLSFVRPDRASLELGIEDNIPFKDLIRGYGDDFVSESEGVKVPRHIERWDYMEVFNSDYDAAQQWKLETGGKLLENGKDIWISDENLEYFNFPDTPENREALKEYLLPQPLEFNWDNFTEEQFNAVREEITSGNIKEDYKGQVYVGSVCVEFTITDKESCWVDYNNYILGEKGEGEISGIPYSYHNGEQVVMNTFTENTYENFKTVIEKVLIEDLGKDSHLKQEAMRPLVDWNDEQQCKELYRTKLVESARNDEITISPYTRDKRSVEVIRDFIADIEKVPANAILDDMVTAVIDNIGNESCYILARADGSYEWWDSDHNATETVPAEIMYQINSWAEEHASNSEENSIQKKDFEIVNSLYEKAKKSSPVLEVKSYVWNEKEGGNMENTFENLSNEETIKYLKDYFNEKNVSISDNLAEEIFYKYLDHGLELKKTKDKLFFYTVDEETGKTEYVSTHKIVDNVLNWNEKELSELHSGTADDKDIESLKGFISQLETIKTHFHRIFETFPPVDFKISDFTGNEKQISFIDDEEKMKDFPKLSKEEFLSSYSYLSEEEYDATAKDYDKLNKSSVPSRFSDTVKTVEDINKVYDRNLDFIEQNISFKYSNPEFNEIDEIEKWKNGELFIPLEDRNGNYTTDMEANTLEEYNSYANKNFKTYSEVIKYQAELKSKLFDSAIENCITEYLRREYAETRPGSGKFEYTVENQSYPIDKEELDYISNTNEWGSADDRLNELIDRRFEEEIEQKEIDIVSDVLEYISQETNGNLVLKNTELNDVLFSDELVQIYAPKEEFLAIQPEETKAALMEAGIARGELYNNVEIVSVSEKARDEMLSANFAGHGGLTQKAFMDNGIEIDLETAKALENCFSQIEAITKYTADGHDLFSKGNGIDTISEHSIEYSEETKSWFIHEKNWLALSAIKGDKADPDDYMEKADRVGDRNWSIGCELLVKYVYQEIKEDGEIEKEFPDTFKKLEHLKDYTESLTEAKQLISDFCFNEYMSTPTFDDLKDVGLAYTTFDDPYTHEEYEIQTSADLINNKITTKVNDKIADSMEYDSLKDMVVNRLNNLDFDSLIYLPSSKLDELLKEERESVENTLLEKADQIIAETFNEPSLAKRAKLYVPSDYGYEGDNKIHILVEFDNNAEREDDLFNALAERHFVLPNGKEVDFNPIKPEKSGTIEQYLDSLERIKENRFQRRKEDKLEKVVVSKENFRDVFNEVIKLPKYKNKPLEAAGFCFSRVPKENKAEVAQWFSNLGCKTKKDTNNLFNKWNKENNPKPDANKSKNNEKDDWSISD
ncbi:MAG: JAB domain-containing protein [Treponema sp.]|nr:JAB domain-containing protein [Treponema sp.]